jgi:putative copper export protein
MTWFQLACIAVHVTAATAWLGSMIFFVAVVIPILRRPENKERAPGLIEVLGARFRGYGYVVLTILVGTGVANLVLRNVGLRDLEDPTFWKSDFGWALAHKLVFVALAIASTVAHAESATVRARAAWIGRATLLFSLGAVVFAVLLVRGRP